jgi:hypothetical protein
MNRSLIAVLAMLLVTPAAWAFEKAFSAEAVQTAPGMEPTRMKFYVAKNNAIRMEMQTPHGEIIQQYFPQSGLLRVIYPAQRQYIEQQSPAPLALPGEVVTNPCDQLPDAQCENLGEETIGQQTAVHWRVSRQGPDNQAQVMEQWLDNKRGVPLRQIFPNGTRIDATLTGIENINGRNAERWEIVMTPITGNPQTGIQWHDPELDVTIRESLPNGSVRELINIETSEPAASLFEVPAGFSRLKMPSQEPRR